MNQPLNLKPVLRDHGIAVYNGGCLSCKPWRDAATGRDYIYCALISTTSLVVQIDVASGRSRSFPLPPGCEAPWGMAFTLEGHVLVPTLSGPLVRIDPTSGKVWITADTGKWLWEVEAGMDGKFYLCGSPDCRLLRYDATTEEVEDLGQLDKVQTYLRGIRDGGDGYIYCSIGCSVAKILAYHIATGRVTAVLPKSEERPPFHQLGRWRDGSLAVWTAGGNAYRLAHGAAFPAPDIKRAGPGAFRQPPTLPDGRPIVGLDPDAVRIGEGPGAKIISYQYVTGGANIFHLAEGPGKTVYGSTIMPLFLLRYTPRTEKMENLGRGAPDGGEAYSFGHCDGKLYYGCYSLGTLMRYDPAKPWHKDPPGGMKWQTNPVRLGDLGMGNRRPRAMFIDSRKRVWVGGTPEYGYRHGGLACYDISRRKLTVFDEVTRDQSVSSLVTDATGDVLYGGTNIGRGSGMAPVTKEARLFAWDTRKKKMIWSLVPVPGMQSLDNLLYRDGKLYGTTGSSEPGPNRFTFFRFDPVSRKMDYVVPSEISGVREQSLTFGPDGNIYGITWMVMFRWRPETGRIEELYRCMGEDAKPFEGALFHRGAVVIDGRYYFSCGTKIMSVPLPLEKITK
jgi:hypothetical protein